MTIAIRPLDGDFEATIERALAQRAATREFITRALADGVREIIFVGVGGSFASSMHATFLLELLATRTKVTNRNAAEFLDAAPARLGQETLVVASSHGGNTPETVAAAELARERGAPVISVSSLADTPLGRIGDLCLSYGNDRTITPAKQTLLAGLVAELLVQGDGAQPVGFDDALEALPRALHRALVAFEGRLADIAVALTDAQPVWVVGSGSGLGAAYTMSICHLVEMQWMPSAYFAAGDFFHGPFELLTEDAQLLVFAGEDPTRPETDRVMDFAGRVNRRPHCIDTANLELAGVPRATRGLVSGIALGVLGSRLLDHLESVRDHDHDLRRYMGKGQY